MAQKNNKDLNKTTKLNNSSASARSLAAKNKAKEELTGFADFVREQGVVGLAIGLAIGVASGATVKSIVDGFINPIIGFILGGANLSSLAWHTGLERSGKELIIAWGSAANSLLTLIATAAVIYFLVNVLKLDKLDKKKEK